MWLPGTDYADGELPSRSTMKNHMARVSWHDPELYAGNGIYIIDEPEAALSPQRQLNL
jgi:predicted ATPase